MSLLGEKFIVTANNSFLVCIDFSCFILAFVNL